MIEDKKAEEEFRKFCQETKIPVLFWWIFIFIVAGCLFFSGVFND